MPGSQDLNIWANCITLIRNVQFFELQSGLNLFAFLWLNLLNPTGYVVHQQFNIQQLYVLPTLYSCVLYLSENKQRLVPLTA